MKLFYFLPISSLAGHEREFEGTCGGEVYSDTIITSPDFDTEPWHYKNHNCTWEVDFGDEIEGFVIAPKHFQLEDTGSSCADYIEIKNEEMHLSICGGILDDTDYAAFASSSYSSYSSSSYSSSEYPDYTGASSSDFWDRRKRRDGDFEGEVQHGGFEEPLWAKNLKMATRATRATKATRATGSSKKAVRSLQNLKMATRATRATLRKTTSSKES